MRSGLEYDLAEPRPTFPDVRRDSAWRRSIELGANTFVIAVLSPFIALATDWMPKLLLGLVVLDIPLQLQQNLFFREYDADRGALGGLIVSATTFCLVALYLGWIVKLLANRGREASPPIQINVALTCYLAISGVSLFFAADVALAFFEFFLLLQLYLVNLYVANVVRTPKQVSFVVSMLLVGCVLASLANINVRLAGGDPPMIMGHPWGLPTRVQFEEYVEDGVMRIGGTIGSSNNAGGYFGFVLAVAISVLFTNLGRGQKLLAAAALALGCPALIFTFSRGGWLGFIIPVLVMFFLFSGRKRFFSWKGPLAACAILALLYLPFHSMVSQRLLGDDKGSAESRIPLMKLAFRIIEDHPVLGVGSNNFQAVMDRYSNAELRTGFFYTVHNKYLLVWAETGILGLIFYLAFLGGALRKGWLCWKFNQDFLSILSLALTLALTGHMVHMNVDVFNGRPLAQLVWLTAGLLTAIHRMGATHSSAAAPCSIKL